MRLPSVGRAESPELEGAGELLPATVDWWRRVWSSPMAAIYLDADVPALTRLAGMVDRVNRGELGSRLLAEIRALEDRFGLSPLARRRLQWEVDLAPSDLEGSPLEDEGRWLRAVKNSDKA